MPPVTVVDSPIIKGSQVVHITNKGFQVGTVDDVKPVKGKIRKPVKVYVVTWASGMRTTEAEESIIHVIYED